METKMNETLLDKLFKNPTPLDRKSQIFWYLHERMFPCREVIEDFLSKTDTSERLGCAKYIVQRLCFEANFPPPHALLVTLLDFEKDDDNKSSTDAYIPQDHFSHIVYTYLLGIYLFFYSPSINKELTREFMRKRKEAGFNPVLDATKDFISFWKYFCLFHDVAYPIESSYKIDEENKIYIKKGGAAQKEQSAYDKYLTNFNKMGNILSREILLEGAVKYLVVWQMLNDHNNQPFSNVMTSLEDCFLQKETQDDRVSMEDIRELFGEYKSVDKIHCFEHFKMFTGFVSSDDYIIVLFDAFSEQPIAFKYTPTSSAPQYHILKSKYSISIDAPIHKLLDHEDYMLHESFFVRYYFKDVNAILERIALDAGCGEKFSKEKLQTVLNGIHKSISFKEQKPERIQYFERITTSHDLNTYIFQCYRAFLNYANDSCPATEKLPSQSTSLIVEHNKQVIQDYLRKNFENTFKHAVIEQMPFVDYDEAEKLMGKLKDEKNFSAESIKAIVNKAVDYLFNVEDLKDYIQSIKKRFADEIFKVIEEEKNVNGLMNLFICQYNKKLFNKANIQTLSFLQEDGVEFEEFVKVLQDNNSTGRHLKDIEKYLNEKMGNSADEAVKFADFTGNYKTENYVYDHGIYGACIFLLCFQYYENIISKLFCGAEEKESFRNIMSTLCWNVERTKYSNKLLKDYEHIASAVFKGIYCHNLYPDAVRKIYHKSDVEWKYDLMKEPSTYFGMMVDALQVWNRDKYYRHSQVDWWPKFSSDYYDIVIEQNRIVLKIKSYSDDISQIVNKFLSEKDTYLKDFSLYVRIDVKGV